MYKKILRPLLFRFGPEWIHHATIRGLRMHPFVPHLHKNVAQQPATVFGLHFPNRLGVAAGLDKNAQAVRAFGKLGFGFVEIGTATPRPQPGNPKPRLFRLPQDHALINRMGFNNRGADAIAKNLRKRPKNLIIGGNIGKNTATPNENAVDDYTYCFRALYDVVDYFVVNVSCPNITDLRELQDKDQLERILEAVLKIRGEKPLPKPVLLKVSPDLNEAQQKDTVDIVRKTGLDGFVVTNTTVRRTGLRTPARRIDEIGKGGLSGRPVAQTATSAIARIHALAGDAYPIIGVGGVFSAADALEKMEAGASLVQLYTGFIYEGPPLVGQILRAMQGAR